MRIFARSLLLIFGLLLVTSARAQDSSNRRGDDYIMPIAEDGPYRWLHLPFGKSVPAPAPTTERKNGELRFQARFPGSMLMRRDLNAAEKTAIGDASFFCVRIYVPARPRDAAPLTVRLVAQHPQWGLFASEPTVPLEPDQWNEICWPLSAKVQGWLSLDTPGLQWNDVMRRRLDSIGLEFFCNDQTSLELAMTDAKAQGAYLPPPPLEIQNLQYPAADPIPVGRIFEMRFDLIRAYDNPFDPDEIAIDVEYVTPSGRQFSLPAFYYQDFVRMQKSNGSEICMPRGKAHWRARFTPTEAGEHKFVITGVDKDGHRLRGETQTVQAEQASFKGFVQVDPSDPHYLSFPDGSFFYPIGLIVRSPYDTRTKYHYEFEPKPDRGLYVYDEIFPQMQKAGLNFTRVWMSSWWLALEWSEGIRPDYAGLGRYSMLSAWRMDYIMNLARKHDLYVALTFQNHGQFSLHVDPEWEDNPFNVLNGGYIRQPDEFWSDSQCRKTMKKRFRYIIARWACDPAIVWYEMSNELDLVHNYRNRTPQIYSWHRDMARFIQDLDPYNHMVTTHYVGGRFDGGIFKMPELEVVQSNGYSQNMIKEVPTLLNKYRNAASDKPAFINEYGEGTRIDTHLSNFHSGLWASGVYPFCGPAMFWYFQYIQGTERWNHYRAFVKFAKDEDYRGRNYSPAPMRTRPGTLQALGMGNNHSIRLWISDSRFYPSSLKEEHIPDILPEPVVGDAHIELFGLKAGKYKASFWDTWGEGGLRQGATRIIEYNGKGPLTVKAPPFRRDIACKLDIMKQEKQDASE